MLGHVGHVRIYLAGLGKVRAALGMLGYVRL
jgi:hypothetical protein